MHTSHHITHPSHTQMRTSAESGGYLEAPSSAPPPQGPGLGPLGPHLKYCMLYCSADAGEARGVYCLYLPAAAKATVVVVQPSAAAAREVSSECAAGFAGA